MYYNEFTLDSSAAFSEFLVSVWERSYRGDCSASSDNKEDRESNH